MGSYKTSEACWNRQLLEGSLLLIFALVSHLELEDQAKSYVSLPELLY